MKSREGFIDGVPLLIFFVAILVVGFGYAYFHKGSQIAPKGGATQSTSSFAQVGTSSMNAKTILQTNLQTKSTSSESNSK